MSNFLTETPTNSREPALEAVHVRTIWLLRFAVVISVTLVLCSFATQFGRAATRLTDNWPALLWNAASLTLLGFLVARWASAEILLKHRLLLLIEISQLRNAYNESDSLISAGLERLRRFYGATHCFVVIAEQNQDARIHLAAQSKAVPIPPSVTWARFAETLLSRSLSTGFAYDAGSAWKWPRRDHWFFEGSATNELAHAAKQQAAQLSRSIGARSLITVPMRPGGSLVARLYLVSPRASIDSSDVHFLRQAIDQLVSQIEHLHLLDKMAAAVAGEERRKISLDLHDSTIQPYLGLKIGLEALRRKAGEGHLLTDDLDELCKMTTDSIAELRRYVHGLKGESNSLPVSFLDGVHRQAERFRKFYGIEIHVNVAPDIDLHGQFATEILQIVGEGLSNVGRHTRSTCATINLFHEDERFVVQTINRNEQSARPWKTFMPRSIAERATGLGGWVDVTRESDGGTAVTVNVPYGEAFLQHQLSPGGVNHEPAKRTND